MINILMHIDIDINFGIDGHVVIYSYWHLYWYSQEIVLGDTQQCSHHTILSYHLWRCMLLICVLCDVCLFSSVSVSCHGLQAGWTALHWASYNGHQGVVEVLVANGADKEAKTNVSSLQGCPFPSSVHDSNSCSTSVL